MRLCVFANIHGDLDALEKVLSAVDRNCPDLVICGGDLVGHGAFPNEVIRRVRNLRVPTLMGDWDRAVGYDIPDWHECFGENMGEQSREVLIEMQNTVTTENKLFLQGLLGEVVLQVYGKTIKVVHESPRRGNAIQSVQANGRLDPGFSHDERWDLLICGKANGPKIQTIGDRIIAYAGNVGGAQSPMENEFLEVIIGANRIKPILHTLDAKGNIMQGPESSMAWMEQWSPTTVNTYEAACKDYR